ncbi:hypothetical protein [Nocardioides litoris]|uniref:hypothetical protein n=1 Tax=Nocardioides litoris TaxID=1926648 RepID=UPI00111EF34C|nr:hypothetical protein [Nocardioides litoris]
MAWGRGSVLPGSALAARAALALVVAVVVAGCSPEPTGVPVGQGTPSASPAAPTSGATEPTPTPTAPAAPAEPAAPEPWATDGPAVRRAARTFLRQVGTYDRDALDGRGRLAAVRDVVRRLATPAFRDSLLGGLPAIEEQVATTGASLRTRVTTSSVAALTGDGARVLTTTVSRGGTGTSASTVPGRFLVQLARRGERWLVAGFEAVVDQGPGLRASGNGEVPDAGVQARARALEAVTATLSYDHRSLGRDVTRTVPLLTEAYAAQYRTLVDTVRPQVRRDRVVVTARPVAAGVVDVGADRVTVVVLLDREVRSTAPTQTVATVATATMELVDGAWLLAAVREER